MESSLSNALLDGIVRTAEDEAIVPNSNGDEDEPTSFPTLVYDEPYKNMYRTLVVKPRQGRRHSTPVIFDDESTSKKKAWDDIIQQFFKKKKKKDTFHHPKAGTLSRSWDDLSESYRDSDDNDETDHQEELKTFVYKPQVRKRQNKFSKPAAPPQSPPSLEPTQPPPASDDKIQVIEIEDIDTPKVPPRNIHLTSDDANVYETPTPSKPPRGRKISAPAVLQTELAKKEQKVSFTPLDVAIPSPTRVKVAQPTPSAALFGGDINLIRAKVLATNIPSDKTPQTRDDTNVNGTAHADVNVKKNKSRSSKELTKTASKNVVPSDQLFCILSVNGKNSQYETSLQSLDPIKQLALWDESEAEAIFYALESQEIFIMSRKLSNVTKDNVNKDIAKCIGVGILPLSKVSPQILKVDRGSIDDWSIITTKSTKITIPLEPQGSVLVDISCTGLQPQAPATCSGTVTIIGLSGVDCYREGEACWTCCTVDFDTEYYGTTSSKKGTQEHLSKGWPSEPIEFEAVQKTSCRIQLWGFSAQETEYWFGESYIPLALVFPYSKHIVHQEGENGPLGLLKSFERDMAMPVEPKGVIHLRFKMDPLEDDGDTGVDVAIKVLEESGMFQPEALAQLKNEAQQSLTKGSITTIPEEVETISSYASSGRYDHLSPSPTPTSSLVNNSILSFSMINKKMTLRHLASNNMKLQVPKSYQEKTFNTEVDPYRELEIVKVELKDTKAKLASISFLKERAELQVKQLEEENASLKQKLSKKKK
jgi:hypothetical protein